MTKFLFVVLAVAAGVGALAGVQGFSASFRETLLDESRTVMAADLALRASSCRPAIRKSRRLTPWPNAASSTR